MLLERIIFPFIVRRQVQKQAALAWRGSVDIDHVALGLEGPLRLRGIKLIGNADRTWVTVDRLEVEFKSWPSLSPKIRAVSAGTVEATAYFSGGRCGLPIDIPEPEPEREPTQIPTVSVDNVVVRIVNQTPESPGRWGFFAYGLAGEKGEKTVEETGEVCPLALREIRVDRVRWDGTTLNSDDIHGQFKDQGQLRVSPVMTLRDQTLAINGKAVVTNVALGDLSQLHEDGKPAAGTVHGNYSASWTQGGVIDGKGMLLLNNADLWTVPVIGPVLEVIHGRIDPLMFSDANAEFRNAGPVITFQKLQIANKLSAIIGAPGSKLNLETQQVDGAVFAAPLKTVRSALSKIPVVKMFVEMSDTFTRLKVTGPIDDVRISKSPMDFVEGTATLFEQTARSGTNLAEDVGSKIGDFVGLGK